MSKTFIEVNDDGMIQCPNPSCGDDYLHVDDVYVAGRPREDGPVEPVHVDADGRVETGLSVDIPMSLGRRHGIALIAWCENCRGRFSFTFVQNKGRTEVGVLRPRWEPIPEP